MLKPLVSILVNCFNGEQFLRNAIDSAIQQTYKNWELVLWDNQSTDNSARIIREYRDPRIKYFRSTHHTNLGDARLAAMQKVRGQWIGILDVDDVWCKDRLDIQVTTINNWHTAGIELGMVYGRVSLIDNRGVEKGLLDHPDFINRKYPDGDIIQQLLLVGNFIGNPSILFSKVAYDTVGGFRPGLLNASDYYLSCAIASQFKVGVVQTVVAKYREHGNNLSETQRVEAVEEQKLILNQFSAIAKLNPELLAQRNLELNLTIGFIKLKYGIDIFGGIFTILREGSIGEVLNFIFRHLATKIKKFYAT